MNRKTFAQRMFASGAASGLALVLAAAALVAAPAARAERAESLPPVQTQGSVQYMSGGIGADSARAMQAEAARWPLTLEFAAKDGARSHDAFLANVKVKVTDAQHKTVLEVVADGPFLLTKLNPGRYQVQASFGGKTLARTLSVTSHAPARAVFVWPHSAEQAEG